MKIKVFISNSNSIEVYIYKGDICFVLLVKKTLLLSVLFWERATDSLTTCPDYGNSKKVLKF